MNMFLSLINISCIAGIAFLFYQKNACNFTSLYWISLGYKLANGIVVGMVYQYYYSSGDTWYFFEEARTLANVAFENVETYLSLLWTNESPQTVSHLLYVGNRNSALIKLISILCILTNHNYWLCASYFSMISFFASWYLFKQLDQFIPSSQPAAVIALFVFPSVVFWSSGLMKESLSISCLYYLTAIFIRFIYRQKISVVQYLLILVALIGGWVLKYYWIAIYLSVFIPTLCTVFLSRLNQISKSRLPIYWISIFVFIILAATVTHPNFHISRIVDVIASNHHLILSNSHPKNVIHFYSLQPTLWSLILNAWWAILSGLFRPFVWETTHLISLIAAIENIVLLILSITFLLHLKNNPHKQLVFIILTYCFILCAFLALSTPNFGTLSRYRLGFLPFYVFVICYQNSLIGRCTQRFFNLY